MPATSGLSWLRSRRVVALIAALTLVASLVIAMIGNSWTASASPENPTVSEEEIVAGPSWTLSVRGGEVTAIEAPRINSLLGPSWG